MNTSRDIETLFDHFGGNAGDYQEIGRENEAKTARTRWPLLATLDLAQPAIPEIASRREPSLSGPRPAAPPVATTERAPDGPLTPLNRAKPPLFARAHRRAIPPVDAGPALDSHRTARFSPLNGADASETIAETIAETAPQVAPAAPSPAFGRIPPVTATEPPAHANGAKAPQASANAKPGNSAAPSILGKLFDRKAEPAADPAPQASSLDSIFTRLREAGPADSRANLDRPSRPLRSRS
jgi:hypothetical protein